MKRVMLVLIAVLFCAGMIVVADACDTCGCSGGEGVAAEVVTEDVEGAADEAVEEVTEEAEAAVEEVASTEVATEAVEAEAAEGVKNLFGQDQK